MLEEIELEKYRLPKFSTQRGPGEEIRSNKDLLLSFETSIISDLSTSAKPIFIYKCKPDKDFFDELRSLTSHFDTFGEVADVLSLLQPCRIEFSMNSNKKSKISIKLSEAVSPIMFDNIVALKRMNSNFKVLYSTLDSTLIFEKDDKKPSISKRESEHYILEKQI